MTTAVVPSLVTHQPVPSRLRSVDLTGPSGRLEAVLNDGLPNAPWAALVCHPHPQGGGTLHNKVVYHAMKVLNDPAWGFGLPVLRFNFRGTGLSQGTHDGVLEADDVRAAMTWLENEYNRPLIVAGFSFGAAMVLHACCAKSSNPGDRNRPPVRALIAFGLPTQAAGRAYAYPFLSDCNISKLFLSGAQDEFASTAELSQVVQTASGPKLLLTLPGSDHFFTGQLAPMQQALAGWLRDQLCRNSQSQLTQSQLVQKELK